MMHNMERKPFTEQIREAVRQSGRTNYDIAKEMNVHRQHSGVSCKVRAACPLRSWTGWPKRWTCT